MNGVKLTEKCLSLEEIFQEVADPSCGAVSFFVGTTRDHFGDRKVVQLEYEAYTEKAEKDIKGICLKTREKWNVKNIAVHHRLGIVPVQEASIIIAVSSEHRSEALEAVPFIINELKATIPIWKQEVYDDDSREWKQNKECLWATSQREDSLSKGKIDLEMDSGQDSAKNANVEDDLKNSTRNAEINPLKTAKKRRVETENQECSSVEEEEYEEPPFVDKSMIQIVASKQELEHRIQAFQQRKREELDRINVQEFCALGGRETSSPSCARASSVILRSKGSSSHLKLTRVVNEWGPQTVGDSNSETKFVNILSKASDRFSRDCKSNSDKRLTDMKVEDSQKEQLPEAIEERLHNLEGHLKLKHAGPVPRDVYGRLKDLEDRVIFLESLSPEYFFGKVPEQSSDQSRKPVSKTMDNDDMSLDEVDQRIHELKMKLIQKKLSASKQESG